MRKWFLISSIALGSLSLGAAEPSSDEQSAWVMGPQWIQEIRDQYQNGTYNNILEELDKEYQEGMAEGRYDVFLDQWKKAIKEWKDVSDEGIQYRQKIEKMQEEIATLDERTNKRLHSVAKGHPELLVSQIIQERMEESTKSATDPNDFIWFNDDPLAIRVRDVINEYAIKHAALHVMIMGKDDISPNQLKNYMAVLNVERAQKMKEALGEFTDHPMALSLAESFDLDLTKAGKSHDKEYLVQLGTKAKLPENQTEERVSSIMADYLQKRDGMIKKYLEEQQ